MLNSLKALFRQNKPVYQKPKWMSRDARAMLIVLSDRPNRRVPKPVFIHEKIYNPGNAKSELVRCFDKLIICKVENHESYWMYITNQHLAKSNMTEKDIEKFVVKQCVFA